MAQSPITDRCSLCETEEDVEYFCTNCDEVLCLNCRVAHLNSRKTRQDKIISLSQARHDDLVHKSTTVFCDEHSSVEITLFCLKCDQIVCMQCISGKHKGHGITTIDDIRDSKAEELQNIIKTLQEKKSVYNNAFDIQGQAYSGFLKSVDKVEKEITEQKAKIIEELNIVCDKQFAELKRLHKNEKKKYSDACNQIQAQNKAVTTSIQTAENSLANNNAALIVKSTVAATQTLQGIEEPLMPPVIEATYQPGDRSGPTIIRIQGKVNVKHTTALYQESKKSYSTTPQIQSKVDTHLGAKPKIMTDFYTSSPAINHNQNKVNVKHITPTYQERTKSHPTTPQIQSKIDTHRIVKPKILADVHKVKLGQKTSGDNKQQSHKDNKPRIDRSRVRIESTVKVKDKYNIPIIVPLQNTTAWIHTNYDPYLTLINRRDKIIATSVSLGNQICDAKLYRKGLLVSCYHQCKLYNLSLGGELSSIFCDLSPYYTMGLCVTHNMDVMVCLHSSRNSNDNKVVRLNTAGAIIQIIQYDVTGAPLYNDPKKVTVLTTGEVIVIDGDKIIVGVDREGKHLFTWEGEIEGRKSDKNYLNCITHERVTVLTTGEVNVIDGNKIRVGVDRERKHLFTWEGEIEGRKSDKYYLNCITHDSNNNVFVTDVNGRLLVLDKDGSGAMCLLDSTQGIDGPRGIAVDNVGRLWVGCCASIPIIEY